MTLAIQQPEYEERLAALAEHLLEHRLTGAVLFDPYYVLYYAGFAFAPTERPVAFVLNAEGKGGMLVPRLEREHAQATASVEDQMAIKSPAEIELIRESSKWGNLAHVLLQRYTRPGLTESEVSRRASTEASLALLDAIGPIYRGQSFFFDGASAGYRGQIGRNGAIPHALANNIVFEAGDVLVTGATAPVWGYLSELERTMVIGPPSPEQRELFDHMVALQDTAFDAIKPGARCSDVDRAVRAYYEKHDLWDYWKHHVGHCIGLRYHEGPFLDIGDGTEIKPGMVFTVEPGLYAAGLGGFRHSDTAAVTADGIELLTFYPRDLESLTLPA